MTVTTSPTAKQTQATVVSVGGLVVGYVAAAIGLDLTAAQDVTVASVVITLAGLLVHSVRSKPAAPALDSYLAGHRAGIPSGLELASKIVLSYLPDVPPGVDAGALQAIAERVRAGELNTTTPGRRLTP